MMVSILHLSSSRVIQQSYSIGESPFVKWKRAMGGMHSQEPTFYEATSLDGEGLRVLLNKGTSLLSD